MATYALLATFSYLVPKHVTCFNRFVISRNKSSTSDTTDGGSDDLHSEDANTPSTNSQKPNGRRHVNIQRIIWSLPSPTKRPMVTNYQCNHYVVCPPVLSNETMKPSKLQRHLKTTHAHLKYFLITCLKSFEGQQTLMRQSAKVCELTLKASYQVALRVAQTKQPYIIAESLILPAAICAKQCLGRMST